MPTSAHSTPVRLPRLLLTVRDPKELTCDACGQPFEAGQSLGVYHDAPIVMHSPHHGGCPPRWTPTVITGTRTGPDDHPQLPLHPTLTVIDSEDP